MKKYGDPDEPGLVVYLNLHHDLVAVGDCMTAEQLNLNATAPRSDYIPKEVRLCGMTAIDVYRLSLENFFIAGMVNTYPKLNSCYESRT